MKFCKDCKNYEPVGGLLAETDAASIYAKCLHPFKINPVTGENEGSFCDIARQREWLCGEKGKYFVPINPEPLDTSSQPKHNSSIKSETLFAKVLNFFRRNT